jgi:hypothetical protein
LFDYQFGIVYRRQQESDGQEFEFLRPHAHLYIPPQAESHVANSLKLHQKYPSNPPIFRQMAVHLGVEHSDPNQLVATSRKAPWGFSCREQMAISQRSRTNERFFDSLICLIISLKGYATKEIAR